MVAYYALRQVAVRISIGEERTDAFGPLTKWASNKRASFAKNQANEGKPKPR
jgi:hypothetical protein